MNEIIVNGITYIPKNETILKDYFVVRTYSAGVFYGQIEKREGKEVTMRNARRLWVWYGAASLSQLAVDGVSRQNECKFPCVVDTVLLTEAIEIIPLTKKALESLNGVPIWKV
jgi:hypothetical protein